MNTDEVLVDFSLPNNPDTLNFIKLSRLDKLKAIALGMRFLSLGIQQQQLWDNSQWEERLEQVKTQEQGKLIILQEKIQLEKLKTQKLIKTQQSEVDAIIEGVRNRTESKFKGEITTLNNNMERMQNKINLHQTEKAQLYKSLNDDFYCKFLSKEQLWESKIERIRNDYEKKLEKEREITTACILTTKHSTIKGQAGEEFTHHELNRRFPTAEIEDTHKQTGRGDFIMKEKDFSMLIETKNYKKNVTKPEIDKFYRDMETNNDIQCGLFLSLKSGICSREDLHLEVINGKPIIFIHNCLENMENIDFAVRIFKLILNTDSIDLSNKEVYEKIKNTIPMVKRYWNRIRSKIQKFEKDMTQCVIEQEIMIRDIFKLLGFNY
uniref:Restriction endonuclease type IV Mrr domain-containing protein n=1 Tax=viral metagenome TaxID=1070528 RepID=A0A6C0C6B9_9ZZZZ